MNYTKKMGVWGSVCGSGGGGDKTVPSNELKIKSMWCYHA